MITLFNKKSVVVVSLALSLALAAGCSTTSNKLDINLNGTNVKNETVVQSINGAISTVKNNEDNSKIINKEDKAYLEQDIAEKVKNYIINGQGDKPEAEKIKWSKAFLDRVDIEGLYKKYIANGGNADDLESFARYMTLNAPIPRDWQELFKKDLYNTYGEKVVKLEHLKDDLYQAYIIKNGSQVPYVVVSSRTGYYHG